MINLFPGPNLAFTFFFFFYRNKSIFLLLPRTAKRYYNNKYKYHPYINRTISLLISISPFLALSSASLCIFGQIASVPNSQYTENMEKAISRQKVLLHHLNPSSSISTNESSSPLYVSLISLPFSKFSSIVCCFDRYPFRVIHFYSLFGIWKEYPFDNFARK